MATDIMRNAAMVVSAYTSNHEFKTELLPDLIRTISAVFAGLGKPEQPITKELAEQPIVPAAKSVFRNYIICLSCGQKNTMLRRHLATKHDMSPEQYRIKWNLPSSYPMVCPDYAKTRSDLAKQLGLGKNTPRNLPDAKRATRVAQKLENESAD